MTGWAGGIANREWKRDRRGPVDGRIGVQAEVAMILAKWRAEHGWRPGSVWNPYTAQYVTPANGRTAILP